MWMCDLLGKKPLELRPVAGEIRERGPGEVRRIVDQDVDRSENFPRLLDHPITGVEIGQIALQSQGPHAESFKRGLGLLGFGSAFSVIEDDVRALAGERKDNLPPDSLRRPCHEMLSCR